MGSSQVLAVQCDAFTVCLSKGFIVCNKKRRKGSVLTCLLGIFPLDSLLLYGSCDLYKSIDPKNEKCRELQPGLYFPGVPLLSMADALLQGNEKSFWWSYSLLLMWWMQFCPFLSLTTFRVSINIFLRDVSIITVNTECGRLRKKRKLTNRKYQGLFFTQLTWVVQHFLLTCRWKGSKS